MFGLKALIDPREYQVIRRRSNLGKDEKARRGLLAHGRPAFGYITAGTGRDKGLRVPHPDEAPVVRLVFGIAAQGRSMRQIAQELSEHGIKPPASCGRVSGKAPEWFKNGLQLWSPRTLRQFIDNPIYLGVSYRNCWVRKGATHVFDPHNPKAIWVENAHEPLVSRELWDAAQRQVESRISHR